MTVVVELFMQPLSERGVLSHAQVRALFSIAEEITAVHRELLRELRERIGDGRWGDTTCVGDVFVRTCEMLRMYATYANNYGNALATLAALRAGNAKFVAYLDEARAHPRCKGAEITSFMILPIQRIPRYVLLLQDLLKHTPNWHADHCNLEEALARLKEIATGINEKKRESENQARVLQIEKEEISGQPNPLVAPHRTFVREGDVQRVEGDKRKPGHLYLFNDILLVTAPPIIGSRYRFKMGLPLDKVVVGGSDSARFFTICSPGCSSAVSTSSSSTSPAAAAQAAPSPRIEDVKGKAKGIDAHQRSASQPTKQPKRSLSKSPAPANETPNQKERRLERERVAQSMRLEAEKAEREKLKREKEQAKSEKSAQPKPMMPEGPFRLDFETQSAEDAAEWIAQLRDTQAAHLSKLKSWQRAKETKGGAATKSRDFCCCM